MMDQTDEIAAAMAGGESAFAGLTERHRRELHVHCYRMLASFDEAEDAVQETMLRAWRSRESFDGSSLFRAWLYRIATNVCLDMLRRSSRRPTAMHSFAEVPWLQPYPDRLLDEVAPSDDEPDTVVVDRETIALAFLAALQVLPPRQRAALLVRDLLGWPASETATLLETSVAAANSAVQRARATMQEHLPARRAEWSAGEPSAEERALLEQFIDAQERGDAAAAVAIAAQDIRITMPPNPFCFEGLEAIAPPTRARACRGQGRRLAPRADSGQPDADGRELPPAPGRLRVPSIQARCTAHRGRLHRGDHDVRLRAVPEFGLPPTLSEGVST
ncbi:MAG: RNA polymerase subunit sigma-70 [Actinomycetota bacterium]